ncbi:hypothetical protein ACFU99_11840 [Streptomyces sp. NPDC057654]|uniref:hypothetical protein n=1 Tax=Streptomyces sp. NPDC057654 TaxID=3346196 RepID=UPI0036AB6F2F
MTATERSGLNTAPAVRTSAKGHAAAMGLDVPSYVSATALRQMAEGAVVARRFAEADAAISATEALPAPEGIGPEADEAELSAARAGIAEALAAEARDTT